LLRLADDREGERRLARGLGAEDLDHPSTRQAADADRVVDRNRAGRDGLDRQVLALAEAHDRALAELALDLGEGVVDGLQAFGFVVYHERALLWTVGRGPGGGGVSFGGAAAGRA